MERPSHFNEIAADYLGSIVDFAICMVRRCNELIQFDIPDIEGVILPRTIESKSNDLGIKSYPNPLHEKAFNIEFKGAKDLGLVKIEIFDMIGRVILQRDELVLNDDVVQLDTQGWPFDVFVITVRSVTGELLYTSKFTKMK